MPNVGGKEYPYTKKGKMQALAAAMAAKKSDRKPNPFIDIDSPEKNVKKFGQAPATPFKMGGMNKAQVARMMQVKKKGK